MIRKQRLVRPATNPRKPARTDSAKQRARKKATRPPSSKKAAGASKSRRLQRQQAEALLREHDARYRTVVDTSREGFWAVDQEGRLLDVNEAYTGLSGYSRDELLQMRVSDLEAKESPADIAAHIQAIIAKGSETFETLHRARDGRVWPAEITVRYHQDHPNQLLCFLRDITERKRGMAELKEREARYRALVETSSDGFWVLDTQGHILEVNDRYLCRSGYTREELLAMTAFDIDATDRQELIRENLANEGTRFIQTRHRAKDGTSWPVEISTVFLPSERGRRYSFLRDVSEREQAEAELRENQERLQLFIEHVPAALAMFAKDMRYLLANRRWTSDYGLGERDIAGLSHYEVFPEIPERLKEIHRRALGGETIKGGIEPFERANGSVQWIRWAALPWRDWHGKIGGIVIFSEDISEVRRNAEMLAAATAQLAVVEEQERRAIALDLHDNLSQLLAGALMRMKSSVESQNGAEWLDALTEAIKNIEQANRSARSLSFQISPPLLFEVGLVAALEVLVEELRKVYGLSVEINDDASPEELSPTVRSVVYRAIRELLINVAKHARVDVAKVDLWSDDGVMKVAVMDSGVGFDKALVEKHATAPGFGLASMRERLRLVGGIFGIDSQPGEGTTAILEVPLMSSTAPGSGAE